jgi:anti-sigma-K factor RskA
MDRELSPDEIQDLLASYSIDAVDDDERRAIEEYLARHPDARAEVSGLQNAASFLAHTGGPPPPGVWERLESTIRETQRPDVPAPPRLVPGAKRVRRPNRAWQWVAAAAVVVAIVFGALWLSDRGGDGEGDLTAVAAAAQNVPGARHAGLARPDGKVLARAVVLPDGTGYVSSRLPALPAGRTYQLWGIGGGETVSLGVMGRDPKVVAFHTDRKPAKLAVTQEHAGGVSVTANDPTAVGKLTA